MKKKLLLEILNNWLLNCAEADDLIILCGLLLADYLPFAETRFVARLSTGKKSTECGIKRRRPVSQCCVDKHMSHHVCLKPGEAVG